MRKFIIGIDIGGSYIKIGKFDKSIKLLEKYKISISEDNSGLGIVEAIYDFFRLCSTFYFSISSLNY